MKKSDARWWIPLSVVLTSAAWADGNVNCDVPREEWRPRVELQKTLKREGWTVRDIKITNGCYEVYGFDEKEAKVEVFFNPKTFQRVQ